FAPLVASAQATLFVSPSSGVYKVGDIFSVLVNVNSGGQAINAASVQMSFDNAKLEVTEVGFSRSIFNIWTEEPTFSNAAGSVRLSGGLPNPGFVGASGAILRVNFKAKTTGQASVVLTSGSVLANDGNGTNILDNFKGGLYNIISAVKEGATLEKPPATSTSIPAAITGEKPITAPNITEWSRSLQSGDTINIKGLAYPNGRILLFVQKGTNDPAIEERFAGDDGRFNYTFSKTVEAGYYRVWAKNVTAEGITSDPSEVVTIEVSQPLFFRIGTVALNYVSIIITIIALLILMLLILVWSWLRLRNWREQHKKEITLTEENIHKAFDLLKEDIEKQIRYLEKSRASRGLNSEEERIIEYLKRDLDDAEKFLRKEIDDIET
ncbi:MAG: cohesin domain-containing protein, partial [Candidatus Paceibacterota bacterium]